LQPPDDRPRRTLASVLVDSPFASIAMARYIPAFLAVARCRSFTEAARTLRVSQPAVTVAVHQLELLLGVRLFDRNTHGVTLTPQGSDFVPTGERLIAELDEALRRLAGPPELSRRQLRIAAVHSMALKVLPCAISRFVSEGSDYDVVLHDYDSPNVWRRVKWNEADLGFASASANEPDLDFQPLLRDRIGVLAHVEHELFAGAQDVRWADLARYDFVRLRGDFAGNMIAQVPDAPASVRHTNLEVSYNALLWAMLRDGTKVSAVPALFAPDARATQLAFRPLAEPIAWRNVFAVTAKGRRLSEAAHEVIAIVKNVVDQLHASDAAVFPL
jgi:DNA-binding transcriptional LysR family regulator